MFKGFETLNHILETEFGVGPIAANPTTAIWAAEFLLSQLTASACSREDAVYYAKQELSAFNEWRHKKGKPLAYLSFGHPLF